MARKPASQTTRFASGLSPVFGSRAAPAPARRRREGPPYARRAGRQGRRLARRPVTSSSREYAVCDLCGGQLGRNSGHFHMVSPLTARHVSVCRTCRRAALSEGYRPRA